MKNKMLLLLAVGALIALSGCLNENDVRAQMCINMDNTYGVRDLDVCGYEMYDNYQSGFVPDCGAEPRNCDWLDWDCQQCERVRTTFENTGWMATMDGEWQYNFVHYNCYQSGWFNEIYHVSFTTDHVCPEACVPTVRMPNAASAYCAEFLCNVPPENPQYVQCNWPSICDQQTGECREPDCHRDGCPSGQTCEADNQCHGPPAADCSRPSSSFVVQPTEGQTIYGQTTVIVNIESAVCEPDSLTVKIDSTVECTPFDGHGVDGGYWVYQCMANAGPQYSDSPPPHVISAIATKGTNAITLTLNVNICNDNDAIPHNCTNEPLCPAECVTDPSLACGTYKLECCSDPQAGCKTLKPECQEQAEPGTHCNAGICNPDGTCSCPQACTDRANQRANQRCGTDWPVTQDCATINCGYTPQVGFNCDATPETRCVNYNGATDCRSGNDIQCGTIVNPVDGSLGAPITGLYCDSLNNPSHKICDSTISACVPVAPKNLANSTKYLMDVSTDSETGMAYNAWFKYLLPENRNTGLPTFGFDKWFGFGYSDTPLGNPLNFFKKNEQQSSFKEGLARFEIENTQLSGPQNYALFNLTDLTRPSGQQTEKIIFKLDAGYSGKCVPEDRKFRGQSGAAAKPKVSYDWGWGYHSTKMKQCDFNSGIYCDSTQFTIALFDRLQVMSEKAEDGNQAFAASLKEWDANVMKDGFSQDFLLDFNHFENNFAFVGQYALDAPPSWFKGTTLPLWSSYLGASPNISFSPIQIDSPGRYHVKLDITWHAGEWNFFDASDSPAADIEVQFTKIADAEPLNPLYLMPFDFDVGKNARPGEAAPNRTGYGTNFQGDSLPLSDSYSASPTGIGINVTKFSTFAQTNPIERRGKLLAIDLQNNSIVFSPVVATPVAMKLENNSGYAQGFYSLKSGGQEITLDPALSLASWSGIGSKNIGNPASPCKGFHEQPLFFRRSDKAPGEGDNYCTRGTTSTNMRGFWWDGLSGNQTIFVQTVFYAPGESFLVNNYCPQGNMDWVSPTEHLSGALNLNYTASQNLKAGSVSDILNRVLDGTVCQYVSPDKQSVVFYWDRNQLESALDNYDFEQIGLLPENRCNR